MFSNLDVELGLVDSLGETKQLGDQLKPENFQLVGKTLKEDSGIIRDDVPVEQLSQAVSDAFKQTLLESGDSTFIKDFLKRKKFQSNETDFLIERLRINLVENLQPLTQNPDNTEGLMKISSNIADQIVGAPKAVEVIRQLKRQAVQTVEGRLERATYRDVESFVEKWNISHPDQPLSETDVTNLETRIVDAIEKIDLEIPANVLETEVYDNAAGVENYFAERVRKAVGETLIEEFSSDSSSFSALDDTAKVELFGSMVDSVAKWGSPVDEPFNFEGALAIA